MKVLIDECLPRRLARELPGHEARTVPQMGWAGKHNGELLALMAGQFEAFITIDGNLRYQQNPTKLTLGLVVLHAPSNRIEDVRPLIPSILAALPQITPGQIVHVAF